MTDIARLGFSADTSDLTDAKAKLDQLVPSADRVTVATDKAGRSATAAASKLTAAAGGATTFSNATMKAAAGAGSLNRGVLMASTGMGTVKMAASGAASTINILGTSAKGVGADFIQADAHVEAYKQSLLALPAAANSATSSLDRLGSAANDNINRLQSTPGNIAAQFQDIGVTAAGGMSPMLIALQQGTQLSSAMAGGLGNLFAGLKQVFSPMTLLTIGLVGLVAAGLQMVDWMALARNSLNFLADTLQQYSSVILYAGAVTAIAFGPQIIRQMAAMGTYLVGTLIPAIWSGVMAMVAFAAANPFGVIVIAIGVVIGAMATLNEKFDGAFSGILEGVRYVANKIIHGFAIAFNYVTRDAQKLVNTLISGFNTVAEFFGFEGGVGQIDLTIDTSDADRDYIGEIADFASGIASGAADWFRSMAEGMVDTPDAPDLGGAGAGSRGADRAAQIDQIAQAYEQLITSTEAQIEATKVETSTMMMAGDAARRYRNEQDLIAQAISANIPLTDAVRERLSALATTLSDAELQKELVGATRAFEDQMLAMEQDAELIGLVGRELDFMRIRQGLLNDAIAAGIPINDAYNQTLDDRANALADAGARNERAEFFADMQADHEDQMWMLGREASELSMAGVELAAFRRETEMLSAARREGIELTPSEITGIQALAREQAAGAIALERMQERIALARDVVGGFLSDFTSSIREGSNVFDAFVGALVNGLNKITDKLLDMAIDGILDMLTKAIASGFSGGFANGAAFDNGITPFAKGGAFTNSIVTKPTLFQFAKGAAMGEMGEAGPEAIIPLKRGPNGDLGVQMTGGGSGGTSIGTLSVEVKNSYTVSGAVSSGDVAEMVRVGAERTKEEIRHSIPEVINEYQRDGTIVT